MDAIGYEAYFFGDGVCLILPEQCVEVTITKELDKGFDFRRIQVTGLEGGSQ